MGRLLNSDFNQIKSDYFQNLIPSENDPFQNHNTDEII